MNWSDKLRDLIRQKSRTPVIGYLRGLTKEERIQLGIELAESWQNFSEFAPINWHDAQKSRENAALIALFGNDQKTFEEFITGDLLTSPFFEEGVLPYYSPEWLGPYIDKLSQQHALTIELTYQWVIRLDEKGYLNASKELIARLLPFIIFKPDMEGSENLILTPETLFEQPITLSTHIWYLFEYDSQLHYADSPQMMGKQMKHIWKQELKELIDSQHLNRNRVLQASLTAIHNPRLKRGPGKWFLTLFEWLSPSTTELLSLQAALFPIFTASSSRSVKIILQNVTTIAEYPDFQVSAFLTHAPALFTHPTPFLAKKGLSIFNKIADRRPEFRQRMTQITCLGFQYPERSTQEIISQFILKYGHAQDPILRDELKSRKANILPAIRRQLTTFLSVPSVESANPIALSTTESSDSSFPLPGSPETKIPPINTLRELVFLTEKGIKNQKPWHLLQLVDAIVRLHPHINEENIESFAKIIRSATRLHNRSLDKNQGNLDSLLSLFLIEYGSLLLQQPGEHSQDFQDIFRQNYVALPKRGSRNYIFPEHEGQWVITEQGPTVYSVFLRLLNYALNKITSGDSLPLLSSPTHAPHWIDPNILVQRMIAYQRANIQANPIDLQLALSRVILTDSGTAGELAEAALHGEWMDLMCFLLFPKERPSGPFEDEAAWVIAAATKDSQDAYPELAHLSKSGLETRRHKETFSWKIGRDPQPDTIAYRLQFSFKTETVEKPAGFLGKVRRILRQEKNHFLLFNHLCIDKVSPPHFSADIARIFSISPHFPELWIVRLLPYLQTAKLPTIEDEKVVTATLRILMQLPKAYAEASHLFVAASFFCNRKNVRLLAVEVWISGISRNLIDSKRFGEIIAQLISGNYGPVKRMATLLNQHLMNISSVHSLALENTLVFCIPLLPDVPLPDTREILNAYQQLLSINSSSISSIAVQNRLNSWSSHRRLTEIIDQLKEAYTLIR